MSCMATKKNKKEKYYEIIKKENVKRDGKNSVDEVNWQGRNLDDFDKIWGIFLYERMWILDDVKSKKYDLHA